MAATKAKRKPRATRAARRKRHPHKKRQNTQGRDRTNIAVASTSKPIAGGGAERSIAEFLTAAVDYKPWFAASENVLRSAAFLHDLGHPAITSQGLLSLPGNREAHQLQSEITALRRTIDTKTAALQSARRTRRQAARRITELKHNIEQLRQRQELAVLLTRVTPTAHTALFTDRRLRDQFSDSREHQAFVMAVDIRRSTELMLKARRPELFAAFMTRLCRDLAAIIKSHFGVFDKFTGDGILAFFPEFFTGPDAGFHAVTAAHEARQIFIELYKQHRASFSSILTDVQLAIGLDYGLVHLVSLADGLTVVGQSVVYACRLSGGPGGNILLNQPAYEQISNRYSNLYFIAETTIEIKHEGALLCYTVDPNNTPYAPTPPTWFPKEERAQN